MLGLPWLGQGLRTMERIERRSTGHWRRSSSATLDHRNNNHYHLSINKTHASRVRGHVPSASQARGLAPRPVSQSLDGKVLTVARSERKKTDSHGIGPAPERRARALRAPSVAARFEPLTVLARDLFSAGPVLRIVLGDTVWLLRRTRTDRLKLTR
jgi:hypothetical protein